MTTTLITDDYTAKLTAKIERLEKTGNQSNAIVHAPGIPGSFITGRSGQSRAYGRKLNRQLDRTIDAAVQFGEASRELAIARRTLELYQTGQIHRCGRTIRVKATRAPLLPIATPDMVAARYPNARRITKQEWAKTPKDYRDYRIADGYRWPTIMYCDNGSQLAIALITKEATV